MMLVISLIAIITASVLMAMELKRFEPAPWWNAPKAPSVM